MADTIIVLGDNEVRDCDAAIVVEGEEVFRLREREKDGKLVVDFDLRADGGSRIAKIAKNYVAYAAPGYTFRNRRGVSEVVEEATEKVMARVEELSPGRIRVMGTFYVKGHKIEIGENYLRAGGITMSGNVIQGFGKAIEFRRGSFGIGVS